MTLSQKLRHHPSLFRISFVLGLLLLTAPALAEAPAETEKEPAKFANTLRWSTASEVDNFGFDVYRGDAKEGPFTRLTKTPISGAGTSDVPHKYSYEDETIEEGKAYWYFVESISMDGSREPFTPVVEVKAKYRESSPGPAFKISIVEDGVYQVGFEDLVAAGWTGEALPAAGLGLFLNGEPVPLHVEAGADGLFGPGDRLELVGHHPRGTSSYFDPNRIANVYQLKSDVVAPARLHPAESARAAATAATPASQAALTRERFEQEVLQLRFSRLRGQDPETWYWARSTSADPEPLAVNLDLAGLEPTSRLPLAVKVGLRGWSWQRAELRESPDHVVEIAWNGTVLGQVEWTGQEEAFLDTAVSAAALVADGPQKLSLRVLPRTNKDGSAIVDVVLLNWVEVTYPRRAELAAGEQWEVEPMPLGLPAEIVFRAAEPVTLYSAAGERTVAKRDSRSGAYRLGAPASPAFVVAGNKLQKPYEVRLDVPSVLRASAEQTDYLIITHASLKAATEPLAAFHRDRGLKVRLIDVEDVYDEFSHGQPVAEGIRAFVSHAYFGWAKPAPRFVLLVGDASWDPRANAEGAERTYVDWAYGPRDGTRFRHNQSTTYNQEVADRNLIPTGSYLTPQGHAASDNYFVAIDGKDHFPELAIGRFPVVAPEEVTAIVDKTIRYMKDPEPGAWRSRVLWITNEDPTLQQHGDAMATQLVTRGYSARRLYPRANGEANALHQAALRQALDEGFSLVHFHGHGGRYIWRTAAPDYEKNADLFTLADLDKLSPQTRLPVVLSMTCYSAPFDHPTADSIGEKFLRLAGKGAVAVYAASWRNSPLVNYSQAVVQEVLAAETLGEGLMKAKRRAVIVPLIEQYNLLGDPALTLVREEAGITLTAAAKGGEAIEGRFAEPAEATVEVEWLSELGEVLATRQVQSTRAGFSAALTTEDVARVTFRGGARVVVARSVGRDGREWSGVLDLAPPAPVPDAAPRVEAVSVNPDKAAESGGGADPAEAEEGG